MCSASHFHPDYSTNGDGQKIKANGALPPPMANVLANNSDWLNASERLGVNPDPSTWQIASPAPKPIQKRQNHNERTRPILSKREELPVPAFQSVVVKVCEQQEPPPRQFVIEGLVPDRAVTSLYGDGGQGKSYLALRICFHVALGIPFADRQVEKRKVLYIDGELDSEEFIRRAYKVARGMGLEKPPEGIYYLQLPGPLTEARIQATVNLSCQEIGATFCVLDSFTMSTFGSDPKEAPDMIRVIKYLETLGTVLAIDHIGKPPIGASNLSQFRQFGSAFKWHGARSILQLIKAEGGGLQILPKKSNFSALSAPICLNLEFQEDRVLIEPIGTDAPEMIGIEDHLPPMERVFRTLAVFGADGARPEQLVEELKPMSIKTIRNHLSILKREKRADSIIGVWRVSEYLTTRSDLD